MGDVVAMGILMFLSGGIIGWVIHSARWGDCFFPS